MHLQLTDKAVAELLVAMGCADAGADEGADLADDVLGAEVAADVPADVAADVADADGGFERAPGGESSFNTNACADILAHFPNMAALARTASLVSDAGNSAGQVQIKPSL